MGVKIPGYHLHAKQDLPGLRKHLHGGQHRRSIHQELTLTSLIDMFSILIIFLIQNFSTQGEMFVTPPNMKLPVATHGQMLDRRPVITVTAEKISLEGAPAGDNGGIDEKIEETDWNLPVVTERLGSYKKFWESLNTDTKFPGDIIIQADKGLNFVYIKRVLYSVAKVGYTNANLAVSGIAQAQPNTSDPNFPTDDPRINSNTAPPGTQQVPGI